MWRSMRQINLPYFCGRAALLLLLSGQPAVAVPPSAAAGENVTVKADSAREDRASDSVRFEGNFEMHGEDWSVRADTATIYGPLDDPERIVADGSPAYIRFTSTQTGHPKEVEGTAKRVEYRRDGERLRLSGEASLRRDANTMSSGEIEYSRDSDQFKAGGKGGVRLMITPESKRAGDAAPR